MDGLIYTNHSRRRFQQRGFRDVVVLALLDYGERRQCRGGVESLFFSKRALADIRHEQGPTVHKMCEKLRNAYLIVSEQGVLITVARSYKRIH